MIKNNKLYDRLKFLTQIGLPAFGALYFALAGIWGLPSANEVVGTIVAVDAFLGVILGISSAKYQTPIDGMATVDHENSQVRFEVDPDSIVDKDEITLKVAK